jgi:hypothetical protein
VVVLLAAALGVVSACGGSAGEVERAESICRQIEATLAAEPGVVGATANFIHSSVNPGDASVNLLVGEGADTAYLTSVATRLVWQSHLDPLRRINITIGTDPPVKTYSLPEQKGELERAYGKRPYTDREYDTGGIVLRLGILAAAGLALALGVIAALAGLWYRSRRARAARTDTDSHLRSSTG